jgi:hypothetical protein
MEKGTHAIICITFTMMFQISEVMKQSTLWLEGTISINQINFEQLKRLKTL